MFDTVEAEPATSTAVEDPLAGAARPRFLRRLLLRPETGGAISALLVFLFFAIIAGQNGFLSPLGTADWLVSASELAIITIPVAILITPSQSLLPSAPFAPPPPPSLP